MVKRVDTVVVGGGPAGLAAAIAFYDAGGTDVVVVERDQHLGYFAAVYSQRFWVAMV